MNKLVARIRFYRICKGLKLEPRQELKDYVFNNDLRIFEGGRANGKTIAALVKTLVYKQVPDILNVSAIYGIYKCDPDYIIDDRKRCSIYQFQTTRCVYMCVYKGINVFINHDLYKKIRKYQKKLEKTYKNRPKTSLNNYI